MPNAVETALTSHLWPGLIAGNGVTVAYARNGTTITSALVVVKGRSSTAVQTGDYIETVVSDDWLALTSELIAAGIGEPQKRDRITWTNANGIARVFEVNLDSGQRQAHKSDQQEMITRIHSKEIHT